ncbi:MAG: esterase-like activity of phytase family protein, partial [Rubrivivax sp.]
FIAVERSFAVGAATPGTGPFGPTGNTIRLYAVDARGATDVSGFESLAGATYTAVRKTLLLDLSDLRNDDGSTLALDNIEGISLGPVLGGQQTLILVSDNNFGSTQFTQFVALAVAAPVPEPATLVLMVGGLAGLGGLVRLRSR